MVFELVDTGTVRPARQAHEDVLPQAHHISAIESPWCLDGPDGSKPSQYLGDHLGFYPPGKETWTGDNSHVVEYHARVLDEHRVGQLRCSRQAEDYAPEIAKVVLVPPVL